MEYPTNLVRIKYKTTIRLIIASIILAIATPALADYLGPDRTVKDVTSTCKVILYECQYITSKGAWKYHKVDNWSCSNESKPWKAYSSNPSTMGCFDATAGDTYWSKEEVLQEVTVTHPSATISDSLQNCNLNNGWCNTSPELVLSGAEPLGGYNILAIEGSLNGQTFACSGPTCNVPLDEGDNDFTFWALSSWGDSSEMGTFSTRVDTISPTLGMDISASSGANGWYVSQTSITATGSDSTSGLSSVLLSVDGGPWETSAILNDGVHSINVQAEDNAGNVSNTSSTISVDTTTPSIDLSLNGKTGDNGWYISDTEITALATDATSGIDALEVSSDGDGYVNYAAPITFIDGVHTIQFIATDNAGNVTETPIQEFQIDTVAPVVDLPATWEVNETITYKVQDDGSGLAELRVVVEDDDEKYAKVVWKKNVSGANFTDEITWDGIFADGTEALPGEYLVWIKTSDMAGNESYTLGIVTVPSPFSLFKSTTTQVSPTELPTPPKELFEEGADPVVTNTSFPTINFGGSTSKTGEVESKSISVSPDLPLTTSTTNSSNILWGAAAVSAIGGIALYARDEKRKREEEVEKKRAEIMARIAEQEARKKAAEEARKIAGWFEGQAILQAQIEERKILSANRRAEVKDVRLEQVIKSLKAKPQEWKTAYTAYMAKKAMDDYRAGEKAIYTTATSPEKQEPQANEDKSWWQGAWNSVRSATEKTIQWVDQHQVEISLGIGVAVGIAALVISGGAATPLVAAAWMAGAAAVAGGTVALGTVGLNAYYGRPLTKNAVRNLIFAGTTAAIVTGAGFLFQGVMTAATTYCAGNSEKCARVEPLLKGIDFAEQAYLQAKMGYQLWIGDTAGALETEIELDLERMDGGMPGNSVAHEIGDLGEDGIQIVATYGDDAISLLLKYGDEAVDIIGDYGDDGISLLMMYGDDAIDIIGAYGDDGISLLSLYGDDAIELIGEHGTLAINTLKAVDLESAEILLSTLDDDVLDYAITQGPDAVAVLSRWSEQDLLEFGPELALRAKQDAKVLQDIKKLVSLGPIDPKHLTREQQELIDAIAEYSTQYSDEGQIVLGKWVDYGNGFTNYARETGSAHYNPHPDMWDLLEELGNKREETAWLVNKQVIQTGIDKGLPFEYTFEGVPIKDISQEKEVVELIFEGATDIEIMDELGISYISIRWKELRELQDAGYEMVFDAANNSFIFCLP